MRYADRVSGALTTLTIAKFLGASLWFSFNTVPDNDDTLCNTGGRKQVLGVYLDVLKLAASATGDGGDVSGGAQVVHI